MKKTVSIIGAILIGLAFFAIIQAPNIPQVPAAFCVMVLGIITVIFFC